MDKEAIEKIKSEVLSRPVTIKNVYEIAFKTLPDATHYAHLVEEAKQSIATEIDELYKSLGYVQLDKDQTEPPNPYNQDKNYDWFAAYDIAQDDMLKAGFKKVK